ncbi:MAG: hypothetical protein H6833_06705 [Planctomycetes bacterium]|nr:hypothetical protein [Planctomycetota bacterium]
MLALLGTFMALVSSCSAGRVAIPASAPLSISLTWIGRNGERGECSLEDGVLRARLARRTRFDQPIFDAVHESSLGQDAVARLHRSIRTSGIRTLPERLEDAAGRAESLRISIGIEGRTIVVQSRLTRAPAIDRVLAAIDADLPVALFTTLPNGPARRGRPELPVDARHAFDVHGSWAQADPSDLTLVLDRWILGHDLLDATERAADDGEAVDGSQTLAETVRALDRAMARDPRLARIRARATPQR